MKKIIPVLLLVLSSVGLASCGNSTPAHSKSYNAGVAWVRDGFPGSNEANCNESVLIAYNASDCTPSPNIVFCESNPAVLQMINYNQQQWIDGCLSVPFKHWPKWLKNYVLNSNPNSN